MRFYWEALGRIHFAAKRFYIETEALCPDGTLFIQPIKEQRDAEEHIVRAMDRFVRAGGFTEPQIADDDAEYITSNMRKAYDHERRGFLDTAEWLLLVTKILVREYCETIDSEDRIRDLRSSVIENASALAQIRCEKDVDIREFDRRLDKYISLCDSLVDLAKTS